MRRHMVTLGSLILLAACGGTGGPSSAGSDPTISPAASDSAAAPMLAWSFGDEAVIEAGDVDLEFTGGHVFDGNAVSFDGQTGSGASVQPGPMDTTSSFSVSAWVSLADPVEYASAVSQVGEEAMAFYLGLGEGTWGFAMKDADTNEPGHTIRASADPRLLDVRTWTHLVGVHDADEGEIRLYVDGVLGAAVAFDQPWQAEGELTIGRSQAHFAPADFWPGSIASVAIYADVLPPAQVRTTYETTGPTGAPPQVASESATLTGTWDYVFDEAGGGVILEDFKGLVDSADEVVSRIGFDGNDWWLGFVFDGELFLLDGVPEGDGGTFFLIPHEDVLVTTGAHGRARITYQWSIDGDSLTLTALKECAVSGADMTCTDDASEMEPIMLLVTDQTFTRSSDDPSY